MAEYNISALARAAKAEGQTTFDPGAPCKYGHSAHRYVSSLGCVVCTTERATARRERTPTETKRAYYRLADTRRDKAKRRAQRQGWYLENRDAELAKRKDAYHADPEAARVAARARRARSPGSSAAYSKKWKDAHPEQARAIARIGENRRRARELGARIGDRRACLAFIAYASKATKIPCYWCKRVTRVGGRHIDHIIPLAKGGADSVGNLCVACPNCNRSKSAKLPEEFAGQSELHLV